MHKVWNLTIFSLTKISHSGKCRFDDRKSILTIILKPTTGKVMYDKVVHIICHHYIFNSL